MATAKEKEKIKTLAAKGQSVNTIKDKTGLPKSTVYYHFKKEVGQKQKEKRLKIPEDEEVKGEICGAFAGDGNYYKSDEGHYRIQFFLNYNDEYWKELESFLSKVLDKDPMVFHDENKSRTVIRYNSKSLYNLFKECLDWKDDKTESIKLKKSHKSEKFKIGFVRGLIDTDGYKESKFRRYIYGTISNKLRNDFSTILEDLNIEHTNYCEEARKSHWRDMYKTRITGNQAEKFNDKIQPRHPKKQYGSYSGKISS